MAPGASSMTRFDWWFGLLVYAALTLLFLYAQILLR